MHKPVTVQSARGVAVLTIDKPPVNALDHTVRSALAEAVDEAIADPDYQAIVIAARGRTFPAGADLRELDAGVADPDLASLCRKVEMSPKPVFAAMHGTVLAAGLELALAAHYRIADRRTRFGLPDVNLGLLPGAGGSQRLTRLIGPAAATEMMLEGRQIDVARAEALGLVDIVADSGLPQFTLGYVARVLKSGTGPRRLGETDVMLQPAKEHLDWLKNRRDGVKTGPDSAPARILDCVEAALMLPFEAALALERTAFEDLVATDTSRALRHVFLAEQAVRRPPVPPGTEPRRIDAVGVVGAGTMGTGIAAACLSAGFHVTLVEADIERLEAGVERIIDIFEREEARGRIDPEQRQGRLDRLKGTVKLDALAGADLVIEAVTEDAAVKRRVFSALDAVMKRGAILGTNTSYLDIDGLAAGTGRSPDVLGLHFFAPAHVMRLLEVVVAMDTDDAVIASAWEFAHRMKKIPVAAVVADGFIANRCLSAYRKAAEFLLEDGASIMAIDTAMRAYGFPMGPFEVADLSGLDIAWARRQRLAPDRDPSERYVRIADRLCELGRMGRKIGRGYYRYEQGARRGVADPEVTAIVAEERGLRGVSARKFKAEEIRNRCLAAMVNEGARLLEEGIAARPADIDLCMIHGFGFPRSKGGPMMAADLTGLLGVKRNLEDYAREDPAFWIPAPLITELVKNGRGFSDMNLD